MWIPHVNVVISVWYGSWHAVYIVCILESYKLMSEPYLTYGTS